jgi:nitroreductase
VDVSEAIRTRRSVRRYEQTPVDHQVLRRLVEAGCWAPTADNAQTWRFVVVTDPARMSKLRMAAPGLMGRAPAAIAVCQDMAAAEQRLGAADAAALAPLDAAMAALNIMLEAQSEGLGTCVVASFNRQALQRLLRLPEQVAPVLLVAVGHPKATPKAPPREVDGVCFFEEYRDKPSEQP